MGLVNKVIYPQGIVENSRAIRQQLVGFNSVLRENIVKESSAQTTDIPGYPKCTSEAALHEWQQQRLHTTKELYFIKIRQPVTTKVRK